MVRKDFSCMQHIFRSKLKGYIHRCVLNEAVNVPYKKWSGKIKNCSYIYNMIFMTRVITNQYFENYIIGE